MTLSGTCPRERPPRLTARLAPTERQCGPDGSAWPSQLLEERPRDVVREECRRRNGETPAIEHWHPGDLRSPDRQTGAHLGAHGTALESPGRLSAALLALGRAEPAGLGRVISVELDRGAASSGGRMISRCGRPHFGHFSSRMTCPASSSLTKSPSRRLHSLQRTCVCATAPTVTARLRLCTGGPHSPRGRRHPRSLGNATISWWVSPLTRRRLPLPTATCRPTPNASRADTAYPTETDPNVSPLLCQTGVVTPAGYLFQRNQRLARYKIASAWHAQVSWQAVGFGRDIHATPGTPSRGRIRRTLSREWPGSVYDPLPATGTRRRPA
jgi:hypothetical protein